MSNGDGSFQAPKLVLAEFNPARAGQVSKHVRIMGNLNDDRRADIVGFGGAGVYHALSNGNGTFAAATFILAAGADFFLVKSAIPKGLEF